MLIPMPVPSTSIARASCQYGVRALTRDSSSMPTVMTADPTTGKILYRPVLPTTVPDTVDITSRPTTRGSVCRPDAVADTPFTYCRYVGRNVIEPSMAKPTMNARQTQTTNTD